MATVAAALADIPKVDHLVLLGGIFVAGKILEAEVDDLTLHIDGGARLV